MARKKKTSRAKPAARKAALTAAQKRWLNFAAEFLPLPAAALREECPIRALEAFVRARPALKLCADAAGNRIVAYGSHGHSRKNSAAPLVLVAHLDHPGFWIQRHHGTSVELVFKGGVDASFAHRGLGVRFYDPGQPKPVGRGTLTAIHTTKDRASGAKAKRSGAPAYLTGATARLTQGRAPRNGLALWDVTPFASNAETLTARACDDLLGAAAALSVLDALARTRPRGIQVWGLFTRSEETGFFGTLEALRLKTLPPQACVLSLECSSAANGKAVPGDGVVVRAGDRASIFDPGITAALRHAADKLKKRLPAFAYQRRLMDGGTCEATPFCMAGFRAGGLALPLINYHNQMTRSDGSKTIGPEQVRVADYLSEVELLLELARHPELLRKPVPEPPRIEKYRRDARRLLSAHPLPFPIG